MTEQLALTSAQTGVWVAQQLNSVDRSFAFAEYCEIAGAIDPVLFERAIREVVATTPALRARFDIGDEGLCQFIDEAVEIPVHVLDVSGTPAPRASAENWIAGDLAKEYDLVKGPLVVCALIKLAPELWLWYRSAHHIVVDGFTHALFASRVAAVYTELMTGARHRSHFPADLRRVVEADTAYQESDAFRDDGAFWREKLAGQTDFASLTTWRPPPSAESFRENGRLAPEDAADLRSMAGHLDVPWPALVIAAVAVQLHRASGVRQLALGLPVSNRRDPTLREIPSMVTNTVPLRLSLTPDAGFVALARQAAEGVTEALRHQRYPMERLARELPTLRDGRRQFGPDVNIMSFDYQGDYAGAPATVHNLNSGPVEDMAINVYNRGPAEGMHIAFDGNVALYTREVLANHVSDFVSLLRSVRELTESGPIAP
ncbi:condensation domain-containing protein [Streptomyces sp. NPDC041068]|uniref:condensation domain-containing protein n=1 Tax=Streptomyces sp. NPDC041068 TaxID=3155130 RepID=UPI0033C68A81